jgi:hypothetical protein
MPENPYQSPRVPTEKDDSEQAASNPSWRLSWSEITEIVVVAVVGLVLITLMTPVIKSSPRLRVQKPEAVVGESLPLETAPPNDE